MNNLGALIRKELRHYFNSPIAYVLAALFSLISGVVFVLLIGLTRSDDMQQVFMMMMAMLQFLCPLITMRLVAEERRTGTLEVLLTAPVSEIEVIVGKFLGAMALIGCMVGLSWIFPLLLSLFGPIDIWPIVVSYLGLMLMSACFSALGILASVLSKNQIVAALLAFGFILGLGIITGLVPNYVSAPLSDILNFLNLPHHYDEMSRGVIDTQQIIYFLSFIGFVLYLSALALRTRKWK